MKRDPNKSSTVLKALRVLEAVADIGAPATAAEIARHLGMERITAYRMLRTIEEGGYLLLDTATKTYRLSNKILALAKPVLDQSADRDWIAQILRSVSQRTGETCHYSELSGIETVLTQREKGSQLVAVDFRIGTRCELHATSVGKAILAHQSEAFVSDYVGIDLKSYTDRTIVDREALFAELDRVRSNGAAYDFEELSPGMNCVAVPVRQAMGAVEAGISISGPITRLTRGRLSELADIMKEEVERAL